jgi:class 3 adenylate cyclase
MQSIELQGEPGAPLARAYPLVSLDESALPYEDEPALPHSVPPERIDVAMSSSERDGAATASSLGPSGRSNQSEEPLVLFAASTTARPALYSPLTTRAHRLAAGAMMTAAGASGAVTGITTTTSTPLPGSPPFLPLLPSTAERVEANPWTLIFVDEELEAEFRATFQPEALVRLVSYAAASICAVSFVCELVALDDDSSGGGGVQWPGTVATAVATSVFLLVGSWRLAPPRSDRAELLRMHGALAVGAVALVVALMAPRSRWAEFRLPPLFTYMVFLSCARPSLFPVSVVIMVILASSLFIFGAEPSRVVTLAVRSSRITLSVLVAACVTLRYFDERDTRRSFLLTRHCVANRARVMVEVQQIVRVLRSCLPASVLAASLDGHEEQTLSQGSWDMAEALKVDPVDLPEWTLLCCTLCDLPALSARLDHAHLVSLVRHFVLLVEAAAAAEGCEVVRAHGGVVLVTPRIEGAAAGRLAPSSVRDRVARIVRVARAVTEGARGLGPLVSPELELAAAAGIATGHCAGGMIGKLRPSFDLIGPASSMAAFLAKGISSGAAGGVAMCERTKRENGADGTRENAS